MDMLILLNESPPPFETALIFACSRCRETMALHPALLVAPVVCPQCKAKLVKMVATDD